MASFLPKPGPPRPTVTRATSLSGKKYGQGSSKELDTLEEWEGARTFRDPRVVTGWVNRHNDVIAAVTQDGNPLLLRTDGTLARKPSSSGGGLFGGGLGSIFKVYTGSAFDIGGEVTRGVFGSEVASFTQGLAPQLANSVVPGLGSVVGGLQNLQAVIDGDTPQPFTPPPVAHPSPGQAAPTSSSSLAPLAIAAGIVLLILAVSR